MSRRTVPLPNRPPRWSMSRALAYTILFVWSLVCLFPLAWVLSTAFKGAAEINGGPFYLPFLDFQPRLDAWIFLLTDPSDNLVARYINSAVVAFVATGLALLIAGMAVYGLTRFRVGGIAANAGLLVAMLAIRVLPPIVVVLPLYLMARATGTLDTTFALIAAYTAINLPVAVWLLLPAFGVRASDQEEAARLDGASHPLIFFTIVVPMLLREIVGAGLLVFILCWNEYLFAAYLATDHAMTLPPWLVGQLSIKEAQIGGEAEDWARFSAATVLMMAPLLVFAGLAQRVIGRAIARPQ